MPDITRYDCHHNTLRLPTTLGSFPEIGKKLSPFEVAEVVLMLIGFLFKTDVVVSFQAVPILYEKDEPLEAVPEEEGQIEEFPLLSRMDEFMIEFRLIERPDGKDEPKQADGKEILTHRVSLDEMHFHGFALFHRCFLMQNYEFLL